jgi:hypothetical protein
MYLDLNLRTFEIHSKIQIMTSWLTNFKLHTLIVAYFVCTYVYCTIGCRFGFGMSIPDWSTSRSRTRLKIHWRRSPGKGLFKRNKFFFACGTTRHWGVVWHRLKACCVWQQKIRNSSVFVVQHNTLVILKCWMIPYGKLMPHGTSKKCCFV